MSNKLNFSLMMPVRCARNKQAGVSLIESMVALVVLALGVMGLAMVQTRMMVETRTANYRATAIGLIDDLSNRILLNRDAAFAGNYALAWVLPLLRKIAQPQFAPARSWHSRTCMCGEPVWSLLFPQAMHGYFVPGMIHDR